MESYSDPPREVFRDRRKTENRGCPGGWSLRDRRKTNLLSSDELKHRAESLGFQVWLLIAAFLLVALYVVFLVG